MTLRSSLVGLGSTLVVLLLGGLACRELSPQAKAAERSEVPANEAELIAEAARIDGLRALIAQRDDRRVIESYFAGTQADQLWHLRSATKSVTSLLVGIAIDQGLISSVDVTLGEILGPRVEGFGAKKAALTLRQLLTMTAGLEWNEGDNVEEFNRWRRSRNPVDHYLERPFVAEPGEAWAYSSGASHLLSVVLGAVTGGTAREYAERVLFEPLEIRSQRWESVAGGQTNGAAGLELAPGDSLKIGQLMLGRGSWEGRRIVSEEWIEASTRNSVATGGEPGYGYQWWITPDEPIAAWAAVGFAGQLIAVVPEAELVIVANSRWRNLNRPSAEQSTEVMRFVSDRVLRFMVPEIADRLPERPPES